MIKVRETFRLLFLFFIISFMLFITYHYSFFLSDVSMIFEKPSFLLFIIIYSWGISFYFSWYFVYLVKSGRIFLFISILFALFTLQELSRNPFIIFLFEEYIKYSSILRIISGVIAVLSISIACFVQFKSVKYSSSTIDDKCKNKVQTEDKDNTEENFFL